MGDRADRWRTLSAERLAQLLAKAHAEGRREGLEEGAHHFRAIVANGVACRELWDLGQERTLSFGPGLNAIVSAATHGLELLAQPAPKPAECTCWSGNHCPKHGTPTCATCG